MLSLQPLLTSLLETLPPGPVEKAKLDELVQKTVEQSRKISPSETRKSQWEYLLKNEVFKLAAEEGTALKNGMEAIYYDRLRRMLDVVLTFTEHDEGEQTFPFIILQDLLETQTITSCSHVFSWIEKRSARLTVGLIPQKGKALILLRSLNDLLRRLSKMGSTTIFCGRILTFLSGVFPLGERSGVNLRGEYGPTWENVKEPGKKRLKTEKGTEDNETTEVDAMQVDMQEDEAAATRMSEKKEEFYNTFWSLQLPFSKPPLFASADTFPQFKESVNKVLPIIKEATAKERAMMGSRTGAAGASMKRKREPDAEEANLTDYFFAKFLTSPDLIDLEVADTYFRRQFLFQLLILLNHLLTFTKAAKAVWSAPNNRALQMDFTLEPTDAQWVQETINKAMEELKQTTPNGRVFAESVSVILEREKNWVNWKNHLCAPFDKAPVTYTVDGKKVGLFEATSAERQKMREPPKDWPWSHGSEALTEIWEMGCRGLEDLENPFQPGDVKDFVKKIRLEDYRIEMKRKALAASFKPKPAPPVSKAVTPSPAPEKEPSTSPVTVQEPPSTPTPSDILPLAAPRPINLAGSPLHPSLPPKPGTSPVKPSLTPTPSSQDVPKIASLVPPTAVPVVTVSTPTPTSAPAALPVPGPTPAPSEPEPALPSDPQILKYEENKNRWAWIALRTARDQYLQHFGRIGTGDIELLAKEIEKEKQDRERMQSEKGEEVSGAASNVLVTGGAGYIGSHVVYTLQKTRRFKVISIDNNHNSFPAALKRVCELSKQELPADASESDIQSTVVDSHNCDLTQPAQIRSVFEKYGKGGIWGVIHIAAYKAVGESTEIPLTYYQNNVSATVSLLQIMDEFDCRRIVYSSSATVYGTPPIIPIPETTRLQADSPYGKTKVMSETIIDDLCQADQRWLAISCRYFNPAGAHPSGYIGEEPRGRPGNLLPLLSHMAIGRVKESVLKVFGNDYPTPDGTCVRDYLHVMDLASGHVLALEALTPESKIFGSSNAHFKAYNLGKGRGMSVLDIVEAMRKATGFDYKLEVIGRRRGDVPDLTADPTLAEQELGFKAPQDLETMCRDLWNWQTKNPKGYAED
ncbi:THO complex subunit 1 transcription elongation factor-domain-containing protein [Lyophyllum atratum]|nr:THO complex subunit 1 transcription elongation factor-domain-containing protein [Lyophyllum atratum]